MLSTVSLVVALGATLAFGAPKCESTFDLAVYGRPCSRGSACFDGEQPLSGICSYRGLCALAFASDTTGDRWECRQCVAANAADGHCREAFPNTNLGGGRQQIQAEQQTNIVGNFLTSTTPLRPPTAVAIIDATSNATSPMANFTETRSPDLTLWIGDPAVIEVGTSVPALGLPQFRGRSLMPGYYMAPRPMMMNASDVVASAYFSSDDGLSVGTSITVAQRIALTVDRRRQFNVSSITVAARPIAYRAWPARDGPPVEPRHGASFQPLASRGKLPIINDAFAQDDSSWTSTYSPQFKRAVPGYTQISVSGSAYLPVATINRYHNVFVAGSAAVGYLLPTSAATTANLRTDVSVIAGPSSAFVDAFDASSSEDSPLRPGTHSALDDDSAIIDTDFVAGVATVWYLANGNVRLVPTTNASGSVTDSAAFTNLKSFFTNKYRIVNFGDRSIVYLPGTTQMRPFGLNTHGEFAVGGQLGANFDGATVVNLAFVSDAETVEWITLGQRHVVVTTNAGTTYFAGQTRWTGAACYAIGDAAGNSGALTKMPVGNVSKAVAGADFTTFLLFNASDGKALEGCGGQGYITPLNVVRETYSFYFINGNHKFVDICAGAYFTCAHRADGFAGCWGSQSVVPNTTGAASASPLVCRANSAATYERSGNNLAVFDAETLSCGEFHVALTTVDDGPGNAELIGVRTAELVRRGDIAGIATRQSLYNWTHRSARTCGSNQELQLGRAVNIALKTDAALPPILGVAEGVATAYYATQLRSASVHLRPLQTVTMARAAGNNTVVATRLRSFEHPTTVLSSFASATGQRPPDGAYRMTDHSGFRNGTWQLSFSALPGVAITIVGNVTQASNWQSSVADTLMLSTDAETKVSGGFQRGVRSLNQTTETIDVFENATRLLHRSATQTVMHFYVLGPNNFVRNLSSSPVGPCPAPAQTAFCDSSATPPQVIWSARGVSVPSGHVSGLSRHAWLALGVVLETLGFNESLGVPVTQDEIDTIGFEVPPTNVTVQPFLPEWPAWTRFESTVVGRRRELHCTQTLSLADCSGASWIEAWSNDFRYSRDFSAFSSSGLFGWPVAGAVANVESRAVSSSVKVLTLRAPTFSREGMTTTEQPSGLRESNVGLGNVCVFLKAGYMWYYVRFHTQGRIVICSFGRMSGTVSPSQTFTRSVPNPPSGPSPASPPSSTSPTWEMLGPDLLRVVNLDANGVGMNSVAGINNMTFELSCAGGLRLVDDGDNLSVDQDLNDYDLSAFLLFTNDTLQDTFRTDREWFMADTVKTFRNASRLLRARSTGALGCDIGYVTHPFASAVSFTRLFFAFRVSRSFVTSGDRVTMELVGSAFDSVAGVRYRVEFDWRMARILDVSNGRGTDSVLPVAGMPCASRPVRIGEFNEVVLEFDASSSRTSIVMNGETICQGSWLTDAQTKDLSAVYLGLANPFKRTSTAVSFREIVACDMRSSAAGILGCAVAGKQYTADLRTSTRSLEETSTQSLNPTDSTSESTSTTQSMSETETSSLTDSESFSINPTPSESLAPTESLSPSTSDTVSESRTGESDSMTASAMPFRWLYLDDYNEDVSTTTLLRRTGLVVKLSVAGDFFNYNENWPERAAGMLTANSSVRAEENAHGLLALLNVEGFVTGSVSENRSELSLQFGPYDGYHSLADENVELTLLPAGFASFQNPPNSVVFAVQGAGAQVSVAAASLELGAFVGSAAGLAFGAPSSLMFGVARNAVLLNYQCFGSERTRISFLMHPLQTEIAGSDAVAMVVFNSALGAGIVAVHLIVVAVLKAFRPQLHLLQAMGFAYFPSLTVLLCTMPAVGATWGAFRAAFTDDLNIVFLLYPAAVCIAVGGTLAYLYSVLYDDSNFCAIFVDLPEDALKARRRRHSFLDMLALPGFWEPIDRQLSFHRRLWFCFQEYTQRRRYFATIDMVALFTETIVLGIPGASGAVCIAQLAVVSLLRVALLATLVVFKPHNYRAGLPIAVVVATSQAVTALFYAMYVMANFTNTLRSVSRGLLLFSTLVLFAVTCCTAVCFARLKLITWLYEREVSNTAKEGDAGKLTGKAPKHGGQAAGGDSEGHNQTPLLVAPNDGGVEPGTTRDFPEQDLDFTRADKESEPGELLVFGSPDAFGSGAAADQQPFKRIDAVSCVSYDSNHGGSFARADAPSAGAAGSALGESFAAQSEVAKPARALPPRGPEVWRLIALEEATDRQCDDVPVFDDDLL